MLDAYSNSCSKFMSGFTNIIELWFAEQVLAYQYNINNIHLEAVLPYQWHEMNYYSNPETCKRYEHVLSKYIVSTNVRWDDDSINGKYERRISVLLRNFFMIDNSSVLICVYNADLDLTGNVTRALQRAEEKTRTVILIDPTTFDLTYRNLPHDWHFLYESQRTKYGYLIPELVYDDEDD